MRRLTNWIRVLFTVPGHVRNLDIYKVHTARELNKLRKAA